MKQKTVNSPVISALEQKEQARAVHAHGSFPYRVLKQLENILPEKMQYTAETGCGRSTILFSNISEHHTAFCIDDKDLQDKSSVLYFQDSEMAVKNTVNWQFGPTQLTLPPYTHTHKYDCVLLDGPHGYPFPDMEYYFFYPHIKVGGYLIIDDIHIPNIGRMADFIQEDAMWEFVTLIATTAVFKRTDAIVTSPVGDNWWLQNFNRRRISHAMEFALDDDGKKESFASMHARNEDKRALKDKFSFLAKVKQLFN